MATVSRNAALTTMSIQLRSALLAIVPIVYVGPHYSKPTSRFFTWKNSLWSYTSTRKHK